MLSLPAILQDIRRIAGIVFLLLGFFVCLEITPRVEAQTTFTWNGGSGTDANWGRNSNWGGTAPANNTTNNYIFGGANRLITTNDLTDLGAGYITFNSTAGTFLLAGNSLTLSGGVTNSSANNQTIALSLILQNTGVIFNAASNDLTITGVITDEANSFGIVKTGTNDLFLTAANTFDGGITVNAGTLAISNKASLGSGTLTFASNNTTLLALANLSITNNLALVGSGIIDSGAFVFTNSGTISGLGSLIKSGSGTVLLTSSNSYSGGTTLGAGTLALSNNFALGTGTVTFASNSTVSALTSISTTNNYVINTGVTGSFDVKPTFTWTNSGVISGAGTLSKLGTGTLILSGVNSYSGLTTITAGRLNVQNSFGLGTTESGTTVTNNSALELQGGIQIGEEALSLRGTGITQGGALRSISGTNSYGGLITLTATTRINSDADLLQITGGIAGNFALTLGGSGNIKMESIIGTGGGALTKDGSGTATLSRVNIFTGLTTVNAGRLVYGINDALSTGAVTISGGTFDIGAFSDTVGVVTLTSGTLAGTTGILTATSYSVAGTGTATANLASAGGLTMAAFSATTTLTGSNSYLGLTTITAGTLNVQNSFGLGTTASGTIVANGSALELQGGIQIGEEALSLNGTLRNISGTNTYGGLITLTAASRISSDADLLQITNTGTITGDTFDLTLGGSGNINLASIIGTGAGALTKDGSGTVTLARANTFTGLTTVSGGSLVYGTNDVLNNGAVTVNGGTFDIGAFSDTVGAVTLTSGTLAGTTGILTATSYSMNGTGTATANLASAGGLTKTTGSTTTTLTGSNSYLGLTTIALGALRVQNSFGLGTTAAGTTVANGSALELQGGIQIGEEALSLRGTGITQRGALRNISGTNTFGGLITLTAATRINSDAGLLQITNAGTITGATFGLILGGAGDLSINSIIETTTGTLTKDGSGTAILSGVNTFTGLTTVSAGRLVYGTNDVLSTGAVTISGGAFDIGAFSDTVGSVTLTTGTLAGTTGILTATSYTMDGTGTATANLASAGALTKSTAATTTTLAGSNSYAGLTTITSGTLKVQNSFGLGTTAAGTTVATGSELAIEGGIQIGAEALSLNGAGASAAGALRNISGSNSYGGLITLASASRINSDAGLLQITNAGTITGATFLLTLGGAGNLSINSIIGNTSGGLTKDGTGTVTLNATNSFIGLTTVNAGRLVYGTNNVLNTGEVTVSGGTFDIGAFSDSVGIVNLSNGTLAGTTGILTATRYNMIGSGTATANLASAGQLNKTTLGSTTTLTGSNSYTGATAISSGTLNVQNSFGLGATNGGTTVAINSALEIEGGISIGNEALSLNGTGVTAGGALRNISGTNTYGGLITLAGVSRINSDADLLEISNAGTITGAGRGLSLGGAGNINLASIIGTISGTLTKDGSGTATLSGVNTFTGLTTVSAGRLLYGTNNVLSTGAVTISGGAFDIGAFSDSVGAVTLNSGSIDGSGTLTGSSYVFNGTGSSSVSAHLGTGTLTKSGAGTVSLLASNAFTAVTNSGGSLALGAVGALGTGTVTISGSSKVAATTNLTTTNAFVLNNNVTGIFDVNADFTWTNGGVISGAGTLSKIGAGTLILSASNTYSSGTLLSGGSVAFAGVNSLGTGAVSLSGGSSLIYGGSSAATLANDISVTSGTGIIGNTSGSILTLGGTLTKSGSILEFYGGSYNVTGKITGSAPNSDLILSSAAVTLSSALNDFNGPTKLLAGSTLTAGVANALPSTSILTIGGEGESASLVNRFNLNGYSQTLGGLFSGTGSFNELLNSAGTASTLTIGGNSFFGGSINGNLALNAASGTANLFGSNSYTGATSVGSGAQINLTNSGSLTGTTSISLTGGTLLLGAANQVKSGIAVNMSAGSTLSLGGNGSSRASSQTFGTLTLTGNSTIDFANLTGTSSLTFGSIELNSFTLTVLNWSGITPVGLVSAGAPTQLVNTSGSLASGSLSQINFFGTSGQFLGIGEFSGSEIVPVPEPSVVLAAILLMGFFITTHLRRRRA